jgi:hypothetical protein
VSKRMLFGTCVTDGNRLKKACEALRKAGIAVAGPRHVSQYPLRNYERKDAWVVKLPGWYGECAFAADGSGDMSGDNESEYFDERPIDQKTGKRIDKDAKGNPHRVHPDVKKGLKLPGDDGRLGDIRLLRRLLVEYTAVGLTEEAAREGGTIAYRTINEKTGEMELAIDIPESM